MISATIFCKDHTGEKHIVQMRPKDVHCVSPFLKEKPMLEGEFAEFAAKSKYIEIGLSFSGIGIKEIGIFGSYTRGDNNEDSDIDILVEFENPIGLEFVDLAYELEELLNHKIDLVSKKAIKSRLINYINEDLIYV